MNSQHHSFTNKLTNLIGIVGVSAAIAFTSYYCLNQPANAQITPNNPPIPGVRNQQTNISDLDRLYILEAGWGGLAEVQLAQLALQKSKNNKIRQYAQQIIREHTPVNQQLIELATRKGITPPTDVGPKYQVLIERLSQLSGSNFDQVYKNEAGINLHMEYLAIQRRQSQLGQDPDLRAFATKNIPVVQKHLQMGSDRLS
ncbi:DUF4142 domain-containing protein [Nostocaceae cyanobacterium CENA369]|uniref:DUF4142 domain-containing protein n=1 Tax=Dendronalium phyllosphericum CENA369 TaxID=1725256 RepID=A0A8J7I284_9NOST|nr:DUF4142 domain-containing protein [Dendronalium phyllosphericum]MBH8572243.1 DUF4142 domain-containing protein [Dendronalium phyllosphericum CENA369]